MKVTAYDTQHDNKRQVLSAAIIAYCSLAAKESLTGSGSMVLSCMWFDLLKQITLPQLLALKRYLHYTADVVTTL